ncbi:MAG: hypothetical protein WDM85_14610 [Caulobacteraceae bacterium]
MPIDAQIAEIVGELDFDSEELHAKYLAERDKRLREDGIGQYVEVKAEFSHYVDDPYVELGFTREPVFDDVDFAVIGGGFGGLLMGGKAARSRDREDPHGRGWRRLRRHLVLEPLPPARCATWRAIAICRCSKS